MALYKKLTENLIYLFSGHPESYIKGPDVASKSKRTFYRYLKLLSDQTTLEDCGFVSYEPWWKSKQNSDPVITDRESQACPEAVESSNKRK
jgi:hypothetical protein